MAKYMVEIEDCEDADGNDDVKIRVVYEQIEKNEPVTMASLVTTGLFLNSRDLCASGKTFWDSLGKTNAEEISHAFDR